MENTLRFCPKQNDNICVKLKTELEEKGIECKDERAARLKQHLLWKCENRPIKSKSGRIAIDEKKNKNKLYPEHDLLPGYIRPNFYEIWLWVHQEPIVKGNITINVTVHE